ncbi:MAG: conjugal transfer protein TraL [Desulfovibrionaceae bacterium]|nr:conjugal transfer protein TraL [Desulfovibrionaceae bacterium]MBF0514195.1 conjugal transfer protein TraL [Desulfovibrionaceae bacterium]
MAVIHFFSNGKGGVGKSTSSIFFMEYLRSKNIKTIGVDADPLNPSFASYKKEFEIEELPLLANDSIDPRQFDVLVERAASLPRDCHMIVDNGSSAFIPFCSYALENDLFAFLEAKEHTVILHTVIAGGGGLQESLRGLAALVAHFPEIPLVVWLNPKDGPISLHGLSFFEFEIYENCKKHIRAIIELPATNASTTGRDLLEHLARKVSFDAALNSTSPVMVRQRLKLFWRDCVSAIDNAHLLELAE